MYIVIGAPDTADQSAATVMWEAITYTPDGSGTRRIFSSEQLPDFIRLVTSSNRSQTVRWAWADTTEIYPLLLTAGVSVARCHDLLLVQRILATAATRPQNQVDFSPTHNLEPRPQAPSGHLPPVAQMLGQDSLFDTAPDKSPDARPSATLLATELHAQLTAIEAAPHAGRLKLLAAAESQGALIAAEIKFFGMPWNRQIHEQLLTHTLGNRPGAYERPYEMEKCAALIAQRLAAPQVNPDSPASLLKAMHNAGIRVESTRKWQLVAWVDVATGQEERYRRQELIEPILRYKKLHRLFTANGWAWLDAWVHDNRFYPSYEVGGVVTGRWGAHGGGAMQIPKDVRQAVQAEAGMTLLVADAAQVEPRILAAMSGDQALAVAARGRDLYAGIAEIGERTGSPLDSRDAAKIVMLGAMYGATSGDSGRLLPHFRKLFPRAMEFTEAAASVGEHGGQVTTFLGRTSPAPSSTWFATQRDTSTAESERQAQSLAKSQGRFTRNFVVQGTAAEWALCWMGQMRKRLREEKLFGHALSTRLVYFLHDEVMLYGPQREAKVCERIVRESAEDAAKLLFGQIPVDFPVTVVATDNYAKAK
ncbi:bifunctional 3'-5' exonuclease/DNA polymerase [Rothia sp. ZJ1223]|uniref:bifunctional 3'-5' exonuclease/DNA polymerase n=1 Tax=Rothia sp. ZJ1223 TaxID=2811098 RepID=UPI0019597CF4|nr:bifunctional 3'-5' exonuclease/DNA polymerase [Rothia sp. ZJ1223]MBM7051972.1 bifunctional 3'-5' exonuclease/DNA polymerase [Rothia sp. ZJ1223]